MSALSRHRELAFWTLSLLVLAWTDPGQPPVLELCLFKWAGLACPGCGMGHAIAYLLDLDFGSAIAAHPLSPFVLVAVSHRIVRLVPRLHSPARLANSSP